MEYAKNIANQSPQVSPLALQRARRQARQRTKNLLGRALSESERTLLIHRATLQQENSTAVLPLKRTAWELFLYQADLRWPVFVLPLLSGVCGLVGSILLSHFVSPFVLPFFFLLSAAIPLLWIESRVRKRAVEFASDYPTVLLAASSSLKAGLTPYQAFERSIRLLPKESLVHQELKQLLLTLQSGVPRERAVLQFGESVRQPDLELFRAAFLLVLENGGRFAPTLARLAEVSNNRSILIRRASVSTASMRMTANVLIVVAPFLLFVMAARTSDYWSLLFYNSTANSIASVGILIIIGCYALLCHMSHFKP